MKEKEKEKYKRAQQIAAIIEIISELESIVIRLKTLSSINASVDDIAVKAYVTRFILDLAILFDQDPRGVQLHLHLPKEFEDAKKRHHIDQFITLRNTVVAHYDIALTYENQYATNHTKHIYRDYFIIRNNYTTDLVSDLLKIKEKLQQGG